MKAIYAILDNVAGDLIGGLHIHRHDASAIRFFGDVANMQDSHVGRRPNDYALVCLGKFTDDHRIIPDYSVVLEGSTWLASQKPTDRQLSLGEPK